jgi:hypothetical protein
LPNVCRFGIRAHTTGNLKQKEFAVVTSDPSIERMTVDEDPADSQTERPSDDSAAEPGAYTDRGESAETAAYSGEGEYSGGEFAGGQVADGS